MKEFTVLKKRTIKKSPRKQTQVDLKEIKKFLDKFNKKPLSYIQKVRKKGEISIDTKISLAIPKLPEVYEFIEYCYKRDVEVRFTSGSKTCEVGEKLRYPVVISLIYVGD